MRHARVLPLILSLALLGRRADGADLSPAIDARTFRPSPDPRATLSLEPVATAARFEPNVALVSSYAGRPVVLRDEAGTTTLFRPVTRAFALDVVGEMGLGFRSTFGFGLGLMVAQTGEGGLPRFIASRDAIRETAIADLALRMKTTLLDNADGGVGMALIEEVLLPTGARTGFAGDGATRLSVRALAEYNLLVASVHASAGYLLRTTHRHWPDATSPGSLPSYVFGDQIPWTLGIRIDAALLGIGPTEQHSLELALRGHLPAGPSLPFGGGEPGSAALSPVLLSFSNRSGLVANRDVYLMAGGEFGLNSAVGNPDLRGILSIGWAPRSHDKDGDGIADSRDLCPEISEDRDGYRDEDGCPEVDDDGDGIVDAEDDCRHVPGPKQPHPKNGCPAKDSDGDGIPDELDACVREKGPLDDDPKVNGCPL